MKKLYLFLFLLVVLLNACKKDKSYHQNILFDFDWKFYLGENEQAFEPEFDDTNWRTVNLPHDFSIELPFRPENLSGKGGGFSYNGVAWYRKSFQVKTQNTSQRVSIQFNGIYRNSEVWINGHYLGLWPYGYTTFYYDLSPYINSNGEENIIAVKVDTKAQPNSRWYSGSGIYRHVWLQTTGNVHFEQWGVTAKTNKLINSNAELDLTVAIVNTELEKVSGKLHFRLKDENHRLIQSKHQKFEIEAQDTLKVSEVIFCKNIQRWELDAPILYKIETELVVDNCIQDLSEMNYGFRTVRFSADSGLFLNNKPLKIYGTNNHHAGGPLGAACFDYTYERQIKRLKSAGCNALRLSHNPPAPELLDAADRLGILVINEVFDEWIQAKLKDGYSPQFKNWFARDIENWVKRDRNHPSVIAWSIGNEVGEQWNRKNGRKVAQMLKDEVLKYDATRPITSGNNKVDGINATGIGEVLDIVGYNYQESMYVADHQNYPKRVIYGSETTVYPYQPGNCGQMHTYGEWVNGQKASYIAGEFLWTGFDYLGEAGLSAVGKSCEPWNDWPEWPWYGSASGIFDICGFEKPAFYFRKALWTKEPMVYLAVETDPSAKNIEEVAYWGWPEVEAHWNHSSIGDTLSVHVYTNVEKVELWLNGKSLGAKNWKLENEAFLVWNVPYENGILRAIATLSNGEIVTHTLQTAGKPFRIELSADKETLLANGQDLLYVKATIYDENNVKVPFANNEIAFEIEGNGRINAVGNGNLQEYLPFKTNKTKAYLGKCLAIVQSTKTKGTIVVRAKSIGLQSNDIVLSVN